jgi:hypothetical protein
MNPRAMVLIGLGVAGLVLAWPRRVLAAGPGTRQDAIDAIEAVYPETRGGLAAKIYDVAARLGAHPFDLANQIAFESGFTFSPSIENISCRQRNGRESGKCAVGLIQFLPSTAAELFGISDNEAAYRRMAAMSAIEQMDYVERYYAKGWLIRKAGGAYDTPHKLALATFYPAYMDKDIDTTFPSAVRAANKNIDNPRDYMDAKLRLAKLSPSFELAHRGEVFV